MQLNSNSGPGRMWHRLCSSSVRPLKSRLKHMVLRSTPHHAQLQSAAAVASSNVTLVGTQLGSSS